MSSQEMKMNHDVIVDKFKVNELRLKCYEELTISYEDYIRDMEDELEKLYCMYDN
ncbi:MAG: hypothetical protein ACRCTZ_17435 [Sarcina sp.]